MKSRIKLFCLITASTCSALLLASVVASISYAENNVKLTASNSAATAAVIVPQETSSWSGYVADSYVFNTVQAEIKVPNVSCSTKNSNLLIWVGFDGLNGGSHPTIEQVGVGADCGIVGSKPNYFTWWEMYPTNNIARISKSVVDVKPGDKILATVSYNGSPNYSFTLKVQNVRSNQTKNTTAKCGSGQTCKRGSAEWIAERKYIGSGNYTPLAKWESDPNMFTEASAAFGTSRTLKPVSYYGNSLTSLNMLAIGTTNHTLATVGKLSASGTTFTSTYHYAK